VVLDQASVQASVQELAQVLARALEEVWAVCLRGEKRRKRTFTATEFDNN
jgi:hypothetical protein